MVSCEERQSRCRQCQDVIAGRDYAERLVAKFIKQIQSAHFGSNRSISIEGIALEKYKSELVNDLANPDNKESLISLFHSMISDESDQDGAPTAANSMRLIRELHSAGHLVMTHYHFRFDCMIGQDRCAIRRIPCACKSCTDQLDEKWVNGLPAEEQPRYAPPKNCYFKDILGNHNKWVIMSFCAKDKDPKKVKEDMDGIREVILDGLSSTAGAAVKEGNYGAICTIDPKAPYYIVKFLSAAYSTQERVNVDGQIIEAGELVADACYLEPIKDKTGWYIEPQGPSQLVTVPMRIVVFPTLEHKKASTRADLPRQMISKKGETEFFSRGPIFIGYDENEDILDEIGRGDKIEFERYIKDEEDDYSDDDGEYL